MTQGSFCDRVRAGETVFGGWAVAPTPVSASVLARGGLDYVVIDLQHGTATEPDLPALTTAIRLAGATPLGRVRYAHPADIANILNFEKCARRNAGLRDRSHGDVVVGQAGSDLNIVRSDDDVDHTLISAGAGSKLVINGVANKQANG